LNRKSKKTSAAFEKIPKAALVARFFAKTNKKIKNI
jgi:hypothetical protein